MKQRWISSMKHTGLIRLVDDDAAIPQFPCAVLVHAGYKVRATKDTNEELHAFRTTADLPDLLVTDVMKPGMRRPEPMRAMPGTGAISHAFLIFRRPRRWEFRFGGTASGHSRSISEKPTSSSRTIEDGGKGTVAKTGGSGNYAFHGADKISPFSQPPEFQD